MIDGKLNLTKSITQKLSNLANKRNVSYQNIATVFFIERLAVRLLLDKTLSKALIFKGGYVGLRVYSSNRFTLDLDALLINLDLSVAIMNIKKIAESNIDDGVWFKFDNEEELITQGKYGGFRIVFRTGIGLPPKNITSSQKIHFDIGIGDSVNPVDINTPELIGNNEISWSVYPLETIIAEKLHALVERGDFNSRSKDVFDIAYFLPQADKLILKVSIISCFKSRKTAMPLNLGEFLKTIDTVTLEKGWNSAVSSLYNPPTFNECFKIIIKFLNNN